MSSHMNESQFRNKTELIWEGSAQMWHCFVQNAIIRGIYLELYTTSFKNHPTNSQLFKAVLIFSIFSFGHFVWLEVWLQRHRDSVLWKLSDFLLLPGHTIRQCEGAASLSNSHSHICVALITDPLDTGMIALLINT